MTSNITISKGGITVTVITNEVTEEDANKLMVLPIPQTSQNQSSGPKDTKIVDLLRITHTIVVKGYITPTDTLTAKEVKDNLRSLARGASTTGGPCSVVYDSDTYNMYIEKLIIAEKPTDYSDSSTPDIIKYEVAITLVEGIKAT